MGDDNRYVINAPAIQTVWQTFQDALDRADDWLTSDTPIPARPLQGSSEWPEGTSMVLDERLRPDQVQSVCKYCDYKRLCAIEETS